jgi:hypothetical protein
MRREERLDDPEEALRLAMENQQAGMWTALPGIVTAVDLAAQTCSVQPAIQGVVRSPNETSANVNLPLLVDVPICWPRGGGFAITFPIKAGDEVLVVFASRCIDSWWQQGGVGAQAEARMHDLSDGFAILAPTSQPRKLANVSTDNLEIRLDDGSAVIQLAADGVVYVNAPGGFNVSAPTVSIDSPDITLGGITWGTHVHPGVQTGTSDTLAPTDP